MAAADARTSTDMITNLTKLLPTGTFLAFQSVAPLFTNNGDCRGPEKIVTGILLFFFFVLCFGLSYVDSVTTPSGKVYYGLVTPKGLYNKQFQTSNLITDLDHDCYYVEKSYPDAFKCNTSDFVNGVLNVIAFGALSCLTPPVTTCYYPHLSSTVIKTGPVLAAMVVGVLFVLFPSGRHGIGYAQTTAEYAKERDVEDTTVTPSTAANPPSAVTPPAGNTKANPV